MKGIDFMIVYYISAVILVILFVFITGFHDEGNLIATIITSRSINVYIIFALAAASEFLGTCLLGTKVASNTINGILNLKYIIKSPDKICMMLCATMLGAIVWNFITWIYSIPSSSSHAIIGGLMGPFVVKFGMKIINLHGLILNVLMPLFTSPLIGFIFGYAILKLNKLFFENSDIKINKFFKSFQALTCIFMNAFQGSNDAQKGMGIIAILIMVNHNKNTLIIPSKIVFIPAAAISCGLVLGGLKMIKSVGTKIYKVKPLHSMSAQLSSSIVIIISSALGLPISGTQIVNSSILGVGAAERPGDVGWQYAKNMFKAWFITIPASFLLSALFYIILNLL